MPREYRHIKQYETEIFSLKEQGLTYREIGERLGYSKEKIENFFRRYHRNHKKMSSGIVIKPKGRPRADGSTLPPSVGQLSKLSQLQYKLAQKERRIKSLENVFTYEEARLLISEYIRFYNNERIQIKTKLTPLEKRSQYVA